MSSKNTWQLVVMSHLFLFSACGQFNTKTPTASNDNKPAVHISPTDSTATPLKPLKISIGEISNFATNNKKTMLVTLKVEGTETKNIEGFRFTDLVYSTNEPSSKKPAQMGVGGTKPMYINRAERKNWNRTKTRSSKPYNSSLIKNNVFKIPGLSGTISESAKNVNIKGKLSLLVASQENQCLLRVKDAFAKGKLTDNPIEFDGGTIQFLNEPDTSFLYKDPMNQLYMINYLFEDEESRLFEIYFEDATGKELHTSATSIRKVKEQENQHEIKIGYNKLKPSKDWTMVIVYGHENCMVTIPFEFKNIKLPPWN